jgi:hypothetical protein
MKPFAQCSGQSAQNKAWDIANLTLTPEEEWQRMKEFLGLGKTDIDAMLQTVESLFRRGHELVVGTYDYLLRDRETAAILGWERGADPAHLAERRRFFTVWLARTLGLDFSHDFARYLFRAGQLHAGHGLRATHVPEMYVTASMSLVNAAFARFLSEDMPGETIAPIALAGWNKVLSMHQHMMSMGYRAARALNEGSFEVKVSLFGNLRNVTRCHEISVHLPDGAVAETVLCKFFNYYPQARAEVLNLDWVGGERLTANGTPWFEPIKMHQVKPTWRVLVNGKDISFFPPGR